MTDPKVSVIVPVYNTERYLRRCLDSLLHQTLAELEIVAIDDGSTDGSPKILRSYAARYPGKIQVLTKEQNNGQAGARNLGLRAARGSYIGFLDSDDFAKPEMYQKLFEAAEAADADYAACGYTDTAEEGGRLIVLSRSVASRPSRTQKDLFFGALVSPFLHLYRREILQTAGVFFTENHIYEDTAFYINLIPYIHRIAEVPEALACRVRRANSTTATISLERIRHIFPVLDEVIDFYRDRGFWDEFRAEVEYMCVRILACSSLRRAARLPRGYERRLFVRDTLTFIESRFPDFRKNPYIRNGGKHLYLQMLSEGTANAYVAAYRVRGRIGKHGIG